MRAICSTCGADIEATKKIPEILKELERLNKLVKCLTVGQIIKNDLADEAGLNPYAINEGLATGDETYDNWETDSLIEELKTG